MEIEVQLLDLLGHHRRTRVDGLEGQIGFEDIKIRLGDDFLSLLEETRLPDDELLDLP